MKSVEVLLRDHVKDLGRCGDVVKVAPGYARNYLIPNRIAVSATEENKRMMQRRRVHLDAEEAARTEEIEARIAALSALTLTTSERADEGGNLYGSVSANTIHELATAKGFTINEKDVRLAAPIKLVGEHKVAIHVHGDQNAEITVVVEAAS